MTLIQIYNKILWLYYGDTIPPASMAANLNSTYGIIQGIHQRIQREWNYWFMEDSDTDTILAGTDTYTPPADWKCEMYDGFRTISTVGYYLTPLTRVKINELSTFPDPLATGEILYYANMAGLIGFYPTPIRDTAIFVLYYKFLPAPVNNNDEDVLMIHGADCIVNGSVMELAETLENANKYQAYAQRYAQSLSVLRQLDQTKKSANVKQRYEDY